MTLAVTTIFKSEVEGRRMHVVTLSSAGDTSYPTGGEPVTADMVGLSRIDEAILAANAGYVFEWDQANKKVKAYYGDNNNASDGPLIEVPDTTDLHSVVTTILGIFFGV